MSQNMVAVLGGMFYIPTSTLLNSTDWNSKSSVVNLNTNRWYVNQQ